MPRVKLVYQAHGEWAEAQAQLGKCKHPEEYLRLDGSFPLPYYYYCRACGTRYIPLSHGYTEEEWKEKVAKAGEEAERLMEELGWTDD